MTGDTENPVLLAANMVLSMLPVIGAIPDIYSLVADPSIFVKALSLIGIIGSIGDLAVLLGVTVPIAAAAALSDAASAILKALYKGSRALLGPVLDAMRFTDAFKVAIDLVKVVVARIQKLNLDLTNDPMGAVRQVLEGTGTLWESFVAFAHRAGMDMLLRLGVDEGSILVGSVLRRGGTLSDDAIVALDNIADDVPEVLEFSDEAIDGLGDAVEALGEQKTRLIFAECIASAFSDNLYHASKVAGHASPMSAQGLCKQSLEVLETLTKEAQQGFNKIDLQLVRTILLNYPDKAQDIGIALTRFPGRASQIAQNAVEAYRHNLNIDLTYRGLAFASDFNKLGDLDLQVARELNARGDILLGVDDSGVKKVLGIPDAEKRRKAS